MSSQIWQPIPHRHTDTPTHRHTHPPNHPLFLSLVSELVPFQNTGDIVLFSAHRRLMYTSSQLSHGRKQSHLCTLCKSSRQEHNYLPLFSRNNNDYELSALNLSHPFILCSLSVVYVSPRPTDRPTVGLTYISDTVSSHFDCRLLF